MPSSSSPKHTIWLDCDPGHDDAIALILALYLDQVDLKGVSTVNGNAPLTFTHANAAQLLAFYRAPKSIPLHRGLAKPLKKEYMHPPVEIHGHSGLDGVLHMPPLSHPSVTHWYNQFEPPVKTGDGTALSGLTDFLRSIPDGEKASIVITGPCTNIAALRLLHPELYDRKVDRVVVMGGALGIPQWTPWAEFNIAVDPDALDVLLKSEDVPVVLVPLNVTHQAIFGEEVHARLLDPDEKGFEAGDTLPKARSELRESISTMLTFFRDAYAKQFEFRSGPPLHDALTIIHLTHPELLKGRWCNLTVNCSKGDKDGETLASFFSPPGHSDQWEDGSELERKGGKKANAFVLEKLDVNGFFEVLLDVIERAEKVVGSTEM